MEHLLTRSSFLVGSWKLSRTGTLSPMAETAMDEIIKKTHGLHQKYYQTTSQSPDDCFYYPDFDQPPYIELPGNCDHNIRGVANFNAIAVRFWFFNYNIM